MVDYVLGAPGSGKSTLVRHLRPLLPGRVVIDWDAFLGPAGELAGAPIRTTPRTWESYGRLVRSIVETLVPPDVVLLGVRTPVELGDWPEGRWVLLDCSDEERRRRLAGRRDPSEVADAVADAAAYRSLEMPVLDTTGLDPTEVARALADRVR